MSPHFKASRKHYCFTGAWIQSSRPTINAYPTLARATQQLSYVSLLLASSSAPPCRARESAAVVRRILVISPESSHHQRRAVLVFARVQMCVHLPLVRSIKCPCREIGGIYGYPLSRPDSFLPWCYFYQWADMTWSMMPFGLVGIWTPFNPMKS